MTDDELIEAMLDTWETTNAGPLESMRAVLAIVREHDGLDAERYRVARRKVCIVGDSFHVINLRPTYVALDAAIEFDAAIDAAIARGKE